jgi:hypothetical protein
MKKLIKGEKWWKGVAEFILFCAKILSGEMKFPPGAKKVGVKPNRLKIWRKIHTKKLQCPKKYC